MGRLEKIVVVTVLFLVAVIVGISLSGEPEGTPLADGGGRNSPQDTPGIARNEGARRGPNARNAAEQGPGGVMSTSLAPRAGDPTGAPPAGGGASPNATPNATPNAASANPALTERGGVAPADGAPTNAAHLNGAIHTNAASPSPANAPMANGNAADAGQAAYIVTRAGLTPTASDEFMLYTWQSGDSFRALAQRYYGSPLHQKRIRDANEGRDEAKLAPGEAILISVMPTAALDRIARPGTPQNNPAANAPRTGLEGGSYTVANGDVLGVISQRVYGTASKWRKIYDANRDVIGADPDKLRPGTVLRIPQ